MDLASPHGRQELGQRIQSAIMAAGFDSLPEFARQHGWSRALIYQYTSGRVLVQLDRLQQIAAATGKPLTWFLAADPSGEASQAVALAAQSAALREQLAAAHDALAEERGLRLAEEQRRRETTGALLEELCRAHRRGGDAAALLEAAARLLEVARQEGRLPGVMTAKLHLGHAWFLQGELTRAEAVLREALEVAATLGDVPALHSIRQELLRVLLQAGQTAAARVEAAALAEAGQWWPRWSGRVSLAAIAVLTGEPGAAAEALDAATAIVAESEESPARKLFADTYIQSNRVSLALACGDYNRALPLANELRAQAARAGTTDQLREAELNLSVVALRRGEVQRAAEQLRLLGEWADLAGDGRMRALVRVFHSELARRCGRTREARDLAQAALQAATPLRQAQAIVEAHLALAEAERERGRFEEAAEHLRHVLAGAEELQYHRARLQAQMLLGTFPAGTEPAPARAWPELIADLERHGCEDLRADALLLRAQAESDAARAETLHVVVTLAKELGYFWPGHAALLQLAGERRRQGDPAGAMAHWHEAHTWRRKRAGRSGCPVLTAAEREVRDALPKAGTGVETPESEYQDASASV